MKRLYYMIKNLIKIARLVSTDDSGNFSRGVASYMGKEVPVLDLIPYGLIHRPPPNSLCVILSQNAQESSALALISDPKRRTLRNLIEGEVALNNQTSGDYIYLKDGNTIEAKTNTVTILTGGTTVTIVDGQVTIDTGNLEVNGNLQVNGTITNTSTIDSGGDITSGADVITNAGISLDDHTHIGSPTAGSGPVSDTGAAQ